MNNKIGHFLLLIIALSAVPHGLEIEWHFLLFASSLFLVSSIILIQKAMTDSARKTILLERHFLTILMFLPWVIYTCLQLAPFELLTLEYSYFNFVEQEAFKYQLGTISKYATSIELIKYISYLVILALCAALIDNKAMLINSCQILFFTSFCIALYSIFNYVTQGQLDLITSIPPWTIGWDKATHGTFSYQNHYAAYLSLTIPIGVGLLIEKYRRSFQRSYKLTPKTIWHAALSPIGFYALAIIIMYIALVLTSSRGGNAIFIIGISFTAFLVIMIDRKTRLVNKLFNTFKWVCVAMVLTVAIILSGAANSLIDRLNDRGFEPNGRDLMRQTAYQIIEQHPLFGTGAGTYPLIQHKYKSPELGTSEMSKRAHNDYLELLANQGFIGFTLLALPILYLLYSIFRSLSRNRESSLYGIKAASFCSIITVLIHSMADFNFQLPAIAIYFFAIMAIALKCDQVSKNRKSKI